MLSDNTQDATPDAGGGIYIIRLSDTHYYGGRTGNFKKRWADHLRDLREGRHYNRRMQRVFDRYKMFNPEVVAVLDPDECPDAEQVWLNANFRKPGCVNLVASSRGGMAGYKATPETISKRVATFKSRPDLIEKARASIARNRVFLTKESYRIGSLKTAAKNRGRKRTPEQIARHIKYSIGRKNTPETIEKMRASAKQRAVAHPTSHDADTRALISTQQRGRVWVNNGESNRRVWPEDAVPLIGQGWVYGKTGRSVAGMVWLIDPSGRRRRVPTQDVTHCIESGYTYPPPPKTYIHVSPELSMRNHRGSIWVRRYINDGWECRRVSNETVDGYLNDGWERGAYPKK